jgi:hypothetical protein
VRKVDDVNVRIIKRIREGPYKENVKKFLVWAIREEFHSQGKWKYKEAYDREIMRLSSNKDR